MENIDWEEKFSQTLIVFEEIKLKLEELQKLLYYTVNQGIENKFSEYKDLMINWLEEIEFNITSYEL
jgi:hypothetical protein